MPIPAMTTMTLLGTLTTVSPSPGLTHANTQDLPLFAETLAQAGMPTETAKPSTPKLNGKPDATTEQTKIPASAIVKPIVPQTITTDAVPTTTTPSLSIASIKPEPAVEVAVAQPPQEPPQEPTVEPILEAEPTSPTVKLPSEQTPLPLPLPSAPTPATTIPLPQQEQVVEQPTAKPTTKTSVETKPSKPAKESKPHATASPEPAATVVPALSTTPAPVVSPVVVPVAQAPVMQAPVMQDKLDAPAQSIPDVAAKPDVTAKKDVSLAAPIQPSTPEQTEIASNQSILPETQEVVEAISLQPTQPLAVQAVARLVPQARAARKQGTETINTSVPTHAISTSLSVTSSVAPVPTVSPVATTSHLPPNSNPVTPDAVATAPIALTQPVASAPQIHSAAPAQTTAQPQTAPLAYDATQLYPTQSLDSPLPAPSHTTLHASPTVLEVGVPDGSHGWLKIRAEIGESGTVQASVSSATHAGHESLHRDLPEMTAFLASEQLPVQVHVVERPQGTVATTTAESDFTQGATTGQGNSDDQRQSPRQQASMSSSPFPDAAETGWATPDYGVPQGGNWVNVVA